MKNSSLKRSNWGKRLAGSTLALSVFTTMVVPTNVLAASKREELKELYQQLSKSEKESVYSSDLDFQLKENPIKDGVDTSTDELQSVIIQFNELPMIEAKSQNNVLWKASVENAVQKEHETFESFLSSISNERSSGYTIKHSYYNTFNGVALDVKGNDIEKLLESGVVKAIWKDEQAFVEPEVNSEESVAFGLNADTRMASSTPLIEVDKLREEGLTGEGIKVGVLDTGVDYNHPDIVDNFKGGYDLVDNDDDPMETTYDDWKNSGQQEYYGTSTYYTSHGTHVSGTIAATGSNKESEFAVTGIAPEVDLYVYRVLGPYGIGSSSDIIAGVEKAVEDGMDVINLSLGVSVTDPLYPTSVACNNAALAGTIAVAANGNAGPELSTLGSPGCSPLTISVGASTTTIKLETFDIAISNGANINGRIVSKNYQGLSTFTDTEYEVVHGGLGTEAEISEVDAKGKVLLIDRGEIPFVDKLTNAKNAGAVAVIFANNIDNAELNVYLGEAVDTLHSVGITKEDGQALKDAINNSSEPLKVKFTNNGVTFTEGDLLAEFSSRGPVSDETIKPDVVAPGVSIFSTFPEYVNSPEEGIDYSAAYSRISGTSMASPHVAGVVALMLQNNPELSAADAKVALMNTCDELADDYAINAMGAGRINAYKAVHADVAVKVLDKTFSIDENNEKIQLDYITGSLSFDRIRKGQENTSKSLPIEINNNGETSKTFNLSVRYLGEDELAQNAEANGVYVEVPENITVNAGESVSFDAAINLLADSQVGRYEGYVILTNSENLEEEYVVPFSATYVVPGIESITLSRPAVSNDLEMMHSNKISGVTATVDISSPLKSISLYVKDYDTKEVIGYIGSADLSAVPGGSSESFVALNSRASYFPMKDGKITENIIRSLRDGKYILKFVAEDLDTDDVYEIEKNILIDNEDAKMTFDKEAGVYEVSDDMYTTEDFFGNEYEAFWIHGNVTDNSIELLQEMGYETDASDILINGFVNGMPRISLDVDKNGDFKFGIEKADLEYGQVYEFSPMPVDVATSQNLFKQPKYFFVKEGAPYTSVTLNKDEMSLNDTVTATVTTHNLSKGSTFNINLSYFRAFEFTDIRINNELQKILDENQYEVKIEKSIKGNPTRELIIKLSIVDKDGKAVDVSNINNIIDVDFKLAYDSECEFYREYIQCSSIDITDKDGNYLDMSYTSTYEGVDIIPTTSTIFVEQLGEGFTEATTIGTYTEDLDQYIWIVDNEGNKYDVTYNESIGIYMAMGLPVSNEEYTVVTELPGHFRKEAKFVPSRTIDGKVVSKVYYMFGSEFYRFVAAGDVNGDGWVDILDALEVEKYYGQEVDYKVNPVDFNFDGIVNEYDMDYIVYNFTQYNEQVAEGEAVTSYEGRTLNDILDATGYNSKVRLQEAALDKGSLNLEVGNSEKLTLTLSPAEYEGEVKWSSLCEDIATVDENGVVTGVNSGKTYVKATADRGQINVYCYVTVTKDGAIAEVESVTTDKYAYEMKVGEEKELTFTVNPEDAVVKEVEFISAADSIVSIVDGKAIAKAPGTTIVTANINSGLAYITWEITVTEADIDKPGEEPGDKPNDPENPGDNPENPSEPGDKPENPGTSDDNNGDVITPDKDNGSANGNGQGTGDDSINKNDNGSTNKPDKNKGNKMPITGGTAALPVIIGAMTLIGAGIKIRKRK